MICTPWRTMNVLQNEEDLLSISELVVFPIIGSSRSWHSDHGRRRDAYPRRVKAVKARVQIDVRLEAERVRRQTDSLVGMPEDSSRPFHM